MEKNNVKFSILVAVYNAEKYLRKCLDSLCGQTMREVQIICVDDASTDGSMQILREYAAADDRVEVYQLSENSGQAHARNVGLQHAVGDYVAFVDSDDWLEKDALKKCYDVFASADDIDCVLLKVVISHENGNGEVYPIEQRIYDGEEAFRLSLTWTLHGWYVVKREIHEKYPYDETCKAYCDDNTTRIHYLHSRKVACCDGVYHYWQNGQSVTRAVSPRRFDRLKANESMRRQLIDANVADADISEFENIRLLVLVDSYYFYFNNRSKLSPQDRRYGLSEMKRVWGNLELSRLRKSLRYKFGYNPLRPFWFLFRLEEETYFFLKKLLRR